MSDQKRKEPETEELLAGFLANIDIDIVDIDVVITRLVRLKWDLRNLKEQPISYFLSMNQDDLTDILMLALMVNIMSGFVRPKLRR